VFGGLAALAFLVEGAAVFGGGALGLPAQPFGLGCAPPGGVDVAAGLLPGGPFVVQGGVAGLERFVAQVAGAAGPGAGLVGGAFGGALGGLGTQPGGVGVLDARDRGLLEARDTLTESVLNTFRLRRPPARNRWQPT
jgi:hypothetical protein